MQLTDILGRLLQGLIVLLVVSTLLFFLLRLSGDPVELMAPTDAAPEHLELIRERFGLDKPLLIQYGIFLSRLAVLDLGDSLRTGESAIGLVLRRLPNTVQLALVAIAITALVGFPIGVATATRNQPVLNGIALLVVFVGQAMPAFWLGVVLILVFSVQLGILPAFGGGSLAHVVLPAVTLASWYTARVARLVRSSLAEVMSQDFVRTARSKGLPQRTVVVKHGLRNSLLSVVTVLGLDLATLLSGSVVTETVFAWPGLGRLLVTSVAARDYPVVQAGVFVIAVIMVVINLIVDILYKYIDPRVEVGTRDA